ncbi:MAG: glycosyltransferase family 39 protein [Deltaproteobacteria bacterium]|nr:glycosyltransferase family 39 protein [Deltaproteobacteria bacterium]
MIAQPRRSLGYELVFVAVVSLVVFVPGIWSYSLVDPWETHYGEVARAMLRDGDLVHMKWEGATYSGNLTENEGFRSKPVLTFWLMSAGLKAFGVANGYSGELTESDATMIGIRLPFILCAVAGLTLMWWMLARLVDRRLAWLALLVVGSCPFFCLVARQAIPDMPMVATTMGALSLFILAMEDGERPCEPLWRPRVGRRTFVIDPRHVVWLFAGGLVVAQAAYYAFYFSVSPIVAVRNSLPFPNVWLPLFMLALLAAQSRDGWMIVRLPTLVVGGVIAAIVKEPFPVRRRSQTAWRAFVDNTLVPWDRHAPERYLVRAIAYLPTRLGGGTWRDTTEVSDRIIDVRPITTMRQVYLVGCYAILGVSVLAKGPPGLTVVGITGVFYVLLFSRWHDLYRGAFELKRGLVLLIAVSLPWHIAMFLKDGLQFVDDYLYKHVLNRAGDGSVDKSFGTFEHYTSQLGHGMWLWAALLPAAVVATFLRARMTTREGRVRTIVALWAIAAVGLFSIVQTKFHHYILPAVPPLAILVAFYLDDLLARRDRMHPLLAAVGIGIALLVCRDLMHEPDRWIEMFIYRYDRPWPNGDPWQIDPSDAFLALGLVAAVAIALTATRLQRLGVIALAGSGLAICVWALQVYMPIAGTHWGMGDAMRTYYQERTINGQKLVYFGPRELRADWLDAHTHWSFDTVIPQTLQVGQPMTITVELRKQGEDKVVETTVTLVGSVSEVGEHTVVVALVPGERTKLDPYVARGANAPRGRPPLRLVDADRLIAWQLYWRGEQFWSGGEIWGWLPENKTSFPNPNNAEFLKYIGDRSRMPVGRRYFVIGDAGRLASLKSQLPTQRGRDTFEIIDTTSNKFWLAWFTL